MHVLDLGCGHSGRSVSDYAPPDWTIVGVDLFPARKVDHAHPGFTYRRGSATDLSIFDDGEFDLVISVGMLEHITDPADFAIVAAEIQRVGRQWALVVPYRYAWLEPHYHVPLFPVLPRPLQRGLVRTFDLHGDRKRAAADPDFPDHGTVWRTNAEYRAVFPGARTRLTPTLETVVISGSAAQAG
jgi:SAM-dependent methyltransferase